MIKVLFVCTTLQDKQYVWVSHNKGNPDYEVKGVTGTYTYGTYVACGWNNATMSILINVANANTFKCYHDYPQTIYFAFIDNAGNVTFNSFTDTHYTPEYAYTKDVTNIQMVMILHEGHTTYFTCTQ